MGEIEIPKQEEQLSDIAYHQKVFWLAKGLWRIVEQDWQEYLRKYHLTINEYSVLYSVGKIKFGSVTHVADYGLMHISTAFNNSQALKKRALLVLEKDSEDTRATNISITAAGLSLLDEIAENFDFDNSVFEKSSKMLEEITGVKPQFLDVQRTIYTVMGKEMLEHFLTS